MHRDLLFCSKSRWFACKNLRWGQGTIETSNSSAKVAVCMHKTTGEGWNPYCLFILVLSMLLCVLKTTDEVWNTHTLVILVLKSLFCIQKPQIRAGTHRYNNSVANYTVLHAQNDKWGLVPLKTCNSGPKCAVLHSKTTDEGWDT